MPFCATATALDEILRSEINCKLRGGWSRYYIAKLSSINLGSSTVLAGEITAWTMETTEYFYKIESTPKNSTWSSEYSEDNGYYETTINGFFESLASVPAVLAMMQTDCLVMQLIGHDCVSRVFGVDAVGTAFETPIKTLRVGRHLATSGTLSGGDDDKPRSELDMVQESFYPFANTTVLESDIPEAP